MHKAVAVIPCYNHPQTIGFMVDAVRAQGLEVVVVDDGSDAACAKVLDGLAALHGAGMVLLRLTRNQGKGGAMMAGLRHALSLGYSHALQIDADGQHETADIPKFLAASAAQPDAVICGVPIYDESVPKARLYGRYATHVWVWINTLSFEIRDSMCGFRVYPIAPVIALVNRRQLGLRMNFDTDILVRLYWDGLQVVNQPTRVSYPTDGVSHFRAVLDNVLISRMHATLFLGMLVRLPLLLARKWRTR
jgi:glycosyltransferase involved in cell wall biosynthesis